MRNCKQCNKEFKPKPYQIARGTGKFCSQECKNSYASANPRIYTDEVRLMVRAMWGNKSVDDIAAILHVGADGLKKQVSVWRNLDYDFPNLKQLARERREAAKLIPKPRKPPKPPKRTIPPSVKPKPKVDRLDSPEKPKKMQRVNLDILPGKRNIHIEENNRVVSHVTRRDSKTLIIHHKKTA